MEQTAHIAIIPSPGMGHLIPLVAFADRLVRHHHFSVTFIVPTTEPSPPKAQLEVLKALPKAINYVFLSPASFEDLPNISTATRVYLTVRRSLSPLRDTLRSLTSTTRLVALVVDLFGTDAFDVANEFHVSPYLFCTSSAMSLSHLVHLPELHEKVLGEYRDLPELKIPGCIPVRGKDLMNPLLNRKIDSYKWFLHHAKRYNLAHGIIVNSFMDLEPGPLKALQALEEPKMSRIYPVGPLIQIGSSSGSDRSECLLWLDNQPCGSVLFVSFGSGGTLSYNQLRELALGLELSAQKFLWVAKSPNDRSNATYFSAQSQNDPLVFLPEGFLDRTKGQGLVVPSWAPQLEVLSHDSIGGFLTHCGWNSILESIVHGVPLIAWPLYAEQQMNAVLLTEDLKVALRPEIDESGILGGEVIAEVVKDLMEREEGMKLRSRMKDLKKAAAKVQGEDGSSTKSFYELAIEWKNQKSI
ncbi:hydroquinone glucosyltransferase-like [Cornus florida]|uniref:hydroquinone glucosyltransferase-like n=1 Tax=Cornus florida TaxID=4283 RepID=UPI00289DE2EB|nr:hydroquinone glucosyltransferase-like [Cornus florida]